MAQTEAQKARSAATRMENLKQSGLNYRKEIERDWENKKSAAAKISATANLIGSSTVAVREAKETSKWLWSGLTIVTLIFLVAGPGVGVLMQLVGGLGWALWPVVILVMMIIWRYTR